ncbi:MAG: hypothetical protein H0V92_03175 [Pseudonocardiales bacterium]|nr:hypothetical protein [Pseudonocardiales bacterium]
MTIVTSRPGSSSSSAQAVTAGKPPGGATIRALSPTSQMGLSWVPARTVCTSPG